MTLTPVESSVKEHTDERTEWKYDDTLPHDLLVPHPDDRQRVPLYDRVGGNKNDTIKVDNGDRAYTGDEEMYLETTQEPGTWGQTRPETMGTFRHDAASNQ